MAADETVRDGIWTREQDLAFENALITYLEEDEDKRWEKIAAEVPGKSAEEIKHHYELLLNDVNCIESGVIPMLSYSSSSDGSACEEGSSKKGAESNHGGRASRSEQERRKGIAWTEDEHRLFLLGLEKYGKGDWRSISRNFVVTRTPTQVASHAQKYFIRLNSMNKDRRRQSIHDITSANNGEISVPQGPTAGQSQTNGSAAGGGGSYGGGPPVPGAVPGAPVNVGPMAYPVAHTSSHR